MKKLITILAIGATLSGAAQDTTYYQKRNELYQIVRTRVTDDNVYKQHYYIATKAQRRRNIIFIAMTGVFFASASILFFGHK